MFMLWYGVRCDEEEEDDDDGLDMVMIYIYMLYELMEKNTEGGR